MREIRSYVARLPEAFIVFGIACLLEKSLIGSYVDEEGWLHEPFFLIPTGFLLIAIGVVGWVAQRSWKKEHSKK